LFIRLDACGQRPQFVRNFDLMQERKRVKNKHKYMTAALHAFGVIFVVDIPAMMM
jgi:hypothetical protein